jgi:hypothetical protein
MPKPLSISEFSTIQLKIRCRKDVITAPCPNSELQLPAFRYFGYMKTGFAIRPKSISISSHAHHSPPQQGTAQPTKKMIQGFGFLSSLRSSQSWPK